MDAFVVDNSVVMAWYFRDERNAYAQSVLRAASDWEVHVPAIWPLEAGNVVLVAERRKRIAPTEVTNVQSMLAELPFRVEQGGYERMFGEIFRLARQHALSTYDASYLDLALRMDFPLATQDKALRRAAGKCGVDLFQP